MSTVKRWTCGALFLVVATAGLATGCTNEDGARRALEGAGYRAVEITGWRWLACGESDGSCTGFSAIGPTGVRVTGAVGCGYFAKGCTVRMD